MLGWENKQIKNVLAIVIYTVPPPIVTISSFPPSGVPMAGDVYILRCTVIVFEEVLAPIEIYWTDSNGEPGCYLDNRVHSSDVVGYEE